MRVVCDTSQVTDLVQRLKNSDGVMVGAAVRAINKVGKRVSPEVVRTITSQVRLTATYVRDKMEYRPATSQNPVAQIVARKRATRLATYSARQLVRSAPRAKGDKLRGIAAGMKQAGVMVGVKRSAGQRAVRSFFYMPLKRGTGDLGGNGMGVFVRTGQGRNAIKHLYGPSVDQVFRGIIPDIEPGIQSDLRDELQREAVFELEKVIRK